MKFGGLLLGILVLVVAMVGLLCDRDAAPPTLTPTPVPTATTGKTRALNLGFVNPLEYLP
ncbi:hypothetical protein LCGC14_1961090 [marine sediment metagenome]|uniref:Uncharacterized protein n=1 Tax=marine sediment metagenome TaxID=412755 RepID=A0A0F9FEM0_9ZZZZ